MLEEKNSEAKPKRERLVQARARIKAEGKHPLMPQQRDWHGRYLPGYRGGYSKGRSVGTLSLVNILRHQLTEHPEDAKEIVKALIAMGKEKELGAIKEMLDRIDGKVVERHQVEGELPIKLVFIPARPG